VTRARVLIADDQDDVRNGFRMVLDAQPDMVVVGEAADGVTALEQARALRPDVVLADIRMPRLDGLELTRLLAGPDVEEPTRVVVVTTFELDEYVHTALGNGACGFLLKRSGPTLLVEAVRSAVAGDTLISPQVTVRLLQQLSSGRAAPGPAAAHADGGLTPREIEIAELVAQGATNREIAKALFLSAGTVKNYVASLLQRKLGTRNRVGIAVWAWATGACRDEAG
jgi:DNA-binding NarL/FixJ family response regulator